MLNETICRLREMELIGNDDIVITCTENHEKAQPEVCERSGATIFVEKGRYILAANNDCLRIFDVDRRTGSFLGIFYRIEKKEITAAAINGRSGSFCVRLITPSGKFTYATKNRLCGRDQENEIARLKEYFTSYFAEV